MTTKVSVYLDERTLDRLRRRALQQRGTLRSLSLEIQELVSESFVLDELERASAEWGDSTTVPTFEEIRPLRASPGASLTRMVREEREHRHEGTPRRQRRA
jgi:hypothetical protein